MTFAGKMLIAAGVIFLLGVIAKIVRLQQQSKEIEKTLDYSKMKEWEEEDD